MTIGLQKKRYPDAVKPEQRYLVALEDDDFYFPLATGVSEKEAVENALARLEILRRATLWGNWA